MIGSNAEMRKGRSFFKISVSRGFLLTSKPTYQFLTIMSTRQTNKHDFVWCSAISKIIEWILVVLGNVWYCTGTPRSLFLARRLRIRSRGLVREPTHAMASCYAILTSSCRANSCCGGILGGTPSNRPSPSNGRERMVDTIAHAGKADLLHHRHFHSPELCVFDRTLISGVGVPHDAEAWIVGQNSLQPLFSFLGAVGDHNHAGMN